MDGYLEREHIPTSAGRRDRGERSIATRQVREPQMLYQIAPEPDTPPMIDCAADAEIVRTVVEGERLTYGYLFNPAFATEISLIDPLPHQRIAVYDHMLKQTRLRFLLADDAGAGKTIMTGLYIREMLTRRLISRVLIVPPAGLVGNWERELRTLFNLPFRIITGNEARSGNPFIGPRSDLLIASVDTLAGVCSAIPAATGTLVAEADMQDFELQDLAEQVGNLMKETVGLTLRFHLRIELGPVLQVSEMTLAKVNEILDEVSENLKLRRL